jgi:hypothetical protein
MGPNEWAALAVAITTIVAGIAGAIRWMVKHYLHELVPNSGSSLKDRIVRVESRVDDIYLLLLERKDNG